MAAEIGKVLFVCAYGPDGIELYNHAKSDETYI